MIPDYWYTKDGWIIKLSDMSTRHLINTIKMLRRQIDGSAHDDFVFDNIDAMQKELKRRVINMSKIENVTLKVAGVTFKNDDGSSRRDIIVNELRAGDKVFIERESDNQFDVNAIKVMTEYGQIGYIGKDYASILAEQMDYGVEFDATLNEFGEYKNRPYCNIIINQI